MKLLGLDVGEKRIGVAKADSSVKIAVPQGAVGVDGHEFENLLKIVRILDIDVIIVGMPRNLKGETTKQSDYVKNFVKTLNRTLVENKPNNKTVKIFFQDESLTSVEAKQNLKNRPLDKKSGAIDAEAATLILQDFLENLSRRLAQSEPKPTQPGSKPAAPPAQPPAEPPAKTPPESPKPQFKPYKKDPTKTWLVIRVLIILAVVFTGLFFGLKAYYNFLISPLLSKDSCASIFESNSENDPCKIIEVAIADGSTVTDIANLLKEQGVIRSPLGFRLYTKFTGTASELQAGTYKLVGTASVAEIVDTLQKGAGEPIVFRFTSLPGETMADIKKRLEAVGYSSEEIDAAFTKQYNHPVLADKPAEASLEGYLFGETYEFYLTDSVETIVKTMLDELYTVVEKNNLRQKFNNMGLTLHEGIILASVVQKEAGTLGKDDQKNVASVFLNRLNAGWPLGSDVTVKYALDQIDPERKTYADNAAALEIDSCYNTRKYAGLPCGAISNPGALVLISTANPSDTSYLYFLTGDDGMMYYSTTEAEHNQAARDHCQVLCNVSL